MIGRTTSVRGILGALAVPIGLWLMGGCASVAPSVPSTDGVVPARDLGVDPGEARLRHSDRMPLGRPPRDALRNADGSVRVTSEEDYSRFWGEVAPHLVEWAGDPRIDLNPSYVAALFAKESGFEPFAMSATPALGLAQFTAPAVEHLLAIVSSAPRWSWVRDQVAGWPRHPDVHSSRATREDLRRAIAEGEISARNEFLFDPLKATLAALVWLRMLSDVWTEDEWPGSHGTFAREALNRCEPLSDLQLLELVTVSYNRGYPYVHELLSRHGRDWIRHLGEEPADHLERVRFYTAVFQSARPPR